MKKLLIPTLAFFSACLLFASCDNGKYDMNPSVDKSNIPNPLNHDGKHAGGAFVNAEINGGHWSSSNGYMDYTIQGQPLIYGYTQPGDITSVQQITLKFDSYHGVGQYYMNADVTGTWLIDSIVTNSTFGQILVDSDTRGIMRGRFNFVGEDLVINKGDFRVIKN